MPNAEQIKQFLAHYVIPLGAGALTTWLFATVHVFNLFGVTEGQVDGEITQGITFGISYGLSWLTVHHILSGVYTPGAKALKAGASTSKMDASMAAIIESLSPKDPASK